MDGLWKEFDGLTKCTKCVCAAATQLNNHSKLLKLMHFLSGLDDLFNQVKSHILIMEPLSGVKITFKLSLGMSLIKKHSSISTLTNKSQSPTFAGKINDTRKFKNKNQSHVCKNCGLKGHSIEKCYKLIGYPNDYKPRVQFL